MFVCCSWFPWQKYISSLKALGTWSSKFCQLNKTNSSLVPFIKVYNPDWEVSSSHLHDVRRRHQSREKFWALFFLFFAVNTTACLVAWRRLEGKLWFRKSVAHKFVQGSSRIYSFFQSLFLFLGAFVPSPCLISVSSYGERGGPTLRRPGHISDTETAGGPCVSCSGVWVHPNVQTSNHSPPSRSGKASPLLMET